MDITTLIGILVSFGLVFISIMMGGDATWFINYPSVMIVMGGTMGATLLAYPLSEVLGVFKVAKNVFLHRSQIPSELIPLMAGFAKKARQEGILSFESQLKDIKDPFLARGIQMAIDGMESSSIEDVMSIEIESKVKEIMSIVFELPLDKIKSSISSEDMEEWDSLKHMALIVALEEEFEKEFEEDAILAMVDLESIINEVSK